MVCVIQGFNLKGERELYEETVLQSSGEIVNIDYDTEYDNYDLTVKEDDTGEEYIIVLDSEDIEYKTGEEVNYVIYTNYEELQHKNGKKMIEKIFYK